MMKLLPNGSTMKQLGKQSMLNQKT
ncbi:unnamed protein product [Linum tenue]|uniref:Uncharacterized protein n=1 Tax=Linum tenue TaxID=586396 RepID=A0AAV0LPR7_9ROSI|nr:unnamed protein product [Linum tenue]